MINFATIIYTIWIIFLVVWFFSAFTAKRSRTGGFWKWIWYRLGMLVVVYLLIRYADITLSYGVSNTTQASIGVILCALGIATAIWARFYLGRNWGMPMSERENPDLVTTGPYKYVRHPIYSGVLLALLGSALTLGAVWAIALVCAGVYFLFSAPIEEKNMARTFPTTYPDYKKRTKMLIPFIL